MYLPISIGRMRLNCKQSNLHCRQLYIMDSSLGSSETRIHTTSTSVIKTPPQYKGWRMVNSRLCETVKLISIIFCKPDFLGLAKEIDTLRRHCKKLETGRPVKFGYKSVRCVYFKDHLPPLTQTIKSTSLVST